MIARHLFLAWGLLLLGAQAYSAQVQLFGTGTSWRLRKGTAEASSPDPAAWRQAAFNDSGWTASPGPHYYSTAATEPPFAPNGAAGFTGTVLSDMQGGYSCVFLRKAFELTNPADISSLLFEAACDDGFIAWINGVEVVRYNMPASAPLFNGVANAALGEPVPFAKYILTNTAMLVSGNNVLSIQAFNSSLAGSSDFGIMSALSTVTDDTPPTVVLISPLPGGIVSELAEIDVDFSEPVTGVDAGDLLINGTAADSVSLIGVARYAFMFPQPPTGGVAVAWASGHDIRDLAHTPNPFAGGSWNYTLNTNVQISAISLSEFLTGNTRGLKDDDGNRGDWIEVNNSGPISLNLEGWFLTDEPGNLTKWRFPRVTIGGSSNLIVFASGKDRVDPLRPLHTNFKLASDGGYLALVSSRTNIITEYNYPAQLADVSYGRDPINANAIGYFLNPTPGALNGAATTNLAAIISDVVSSPLVPAPNQNIVVTARVTPAFNALSNVTLRYRVMYGAEQTLAMFDDGAHGDGPAKDGIFGATIPVYPTNRWQMIRWYVRATDVKSNVIRLPLFANVATQPDQPEFLGTVVDAYNITSNLPVLHWFIQTPTAADNTAGTRCSIFYNGQFRDNVSAYIHGQSSSGFPKKSYNINLNPGGKLRWSEDAPAISAINLLTTYADKSHMRNMLNTQSYIDAGSPAHFAFAVRVHQNGRFFSVANFVENGDDHYLERIGYDPNGSLYKMYNTGGDAFSGVEKKTRKYEGNQDLAALIAGVGQGATFMFDNMDIANFVDFCAVKTVTSDHDCCHKNYYFYRDSDVTREWRALPWDFDLSMGRQWNSTDNYFDDRNLVNLGLFTGGNNTVVGTIFNNAATKQMYLRRVRTLTDEQLGLPGATNTYFEKMIEYQKGLIGPDAALDFATWPTWKTVMTLTNNANEIKTNYVPGRRAYLNTTLSVTSGGEVPLSQPGNAVVSIAGFDYNPSSGNQDQEWIRLTNANTYAVDISGWKLSGGVNFTFRGGTVIPINGVLYVSPNVVAFRARTVAPRGGQGLYVVGPYDGRLAAWGESVTLTDKNGRVVTTNGYPSNPSAAQRFLRITELMYHPSVGGPYDAEEYEYVELKNTGGTALDLRGVRFVNGLEFDFTTSAVTNLAAGASVLVVHNPTAFASRFGAGLNVAGQFAGSLDNSGEPLRLDDRTGETILDFRYENSWYPITDGAGFSLVIVNENAAGETWGEKPSWRASAHGGGSPGLTDPPPTTVPSVLVNEALTHTVPPDVDAIELFNPGLTPVEVGNWFLTDDFSEPKKFRIPADTIIAAGGFLEFTEADFNPGGVGFALSSDSDEVWLFSGDSNTNLTGYYHGFSFGAADNSVSFGRYLNSQAEEFFVAQSANTLSNGNAYPKVGPVVLGEIMYHPPDSGTNDNQTEEFIELQNITGGSVALFDAANPTNTWRLRNAVDFDFPTNITLAAGGRLLVVGFDPTTNAAALAQFQTAYFVPPGVPILGPWDGKLDNSDESLELKKPAPATAEGVPYILVESVHYRDTAPWPLDADGIGGSLQRAVLSGFGNDPTNWFSSGATPGAENLYNAPPTISILTPTPGGFYQQPTNIAITVNAADLDGSVTLVEFFSDGVKFGESSVAPFSFTWAGAPFGVHVLTARARDNGNVKTVSAPVNITVASQPPVVSLTSPSEGALIPAGTVTALSATATDPDGAIAAVSFLVDGVKVGEQATPPYSFNWVAGPVGYRTLQAVARDSSGTSSTSGVARVFVSGLINSNVVLVASNSVWRYWENGTDLGTAWSQPAFDDSGWKSGPAQIGWGDNDEATRVTNNVIAGGKTNRIITYYFRRSFVVDSFVGVTNVVLRLQRDDGGIVYLNGSEVFRSNMTNEPVDYLTLALLAITGAAENAMFPTNLPTSVLHLGTNTIAVEIHQGRTNDNDMSFAAELLLNRSLSGPAITAQPQSVTNVPGSTAAFTVSVLGTPPLSFQWQFNGADLGGETQPMLTLAGVQPAQAGGYTVIVTNFAGSVTSEVATLTVLSADSDGDGLPDDWEIANGTDPHLADANTDPDHDGMTNVQEYLAGTNPQDSASVLRVSLQLATGAYDLRFNAVARRSYEVQFRPQLDLGNWTILTNLPSAPTDRAISILDPGQPGVTNRYYRLLATPQP